jgi:hypothetical protein
MYTIIEKQFIGPEIENPTFYSIHHVSIYNGKIKLPVKYRTRSSGWLGLIHHWSLIGHGAFDDVEEARSRLQLIFGPCRPADPDEWTGLPWEENETERHFVGAHRRLGPMLTQRFIDERIRKLLRGELTCARITKFLEQCETQANNEGCGLDLKVARAYIYEGLEAVGGPERYWKEAMSCAEADEA